MFVAKALYWYLSGKRKGKYSVELKSVYNRLRDVENIGPLVSKQQALRYLFYIPKAYISFLFKLKKGADKKSFVFSHGGGIDQRVKFLSKYSKDFNPDKTIFFNSEGRGEYHSQKGPIGAALSGLGLAVFMELILFLSIFGRSKFSKFWLIRFYHNALQLYLIAPKQAEVTIFMMFKLDSYFTALLSDKLGINTTCVLSNSSICGYNRYNDLPKSRFILCSKFQEYELQSFLDLNWTRIGGWQYWGLEEVVEFDEPVEGKYEYDIGVYSGAEWARINGIRIEGIGNDMSLEDNWEYNKFLNDTLLPIVRLKKKIDRLKISVLTHPYERELINERRLFPPYLELLEDSGIDLIYDAGDSMSTIPKVRIGIALFSTIIFDRLTLGFDGLILSDRDAQGVKNHDSFRTHFIGPYAKNTFKHGHELYEKLQGIFQNHNP